MNQNGDATQREAIAYVRYGDAVYSGFKTRAICRKDAELFVLERDNELQVKAKVFYDGELMSHPISILDIPVTGWLCQIIRP